MTAKKICHLKIPFACRAGSAFDESYFDPDEYPPKDLNGFSSLTVRPIEGYWRQCQRCGEFTRIIGRHPYCTECNWDALEDCTLMSAA